MKTVIIGGVAGGATCAARLRRLDEAMEIVVLERGEYVSFANCGLPYHIGGEIKSRSALILQTPEAMKKKYRIDVRTGSTVTAIDRASKTVTVRKSDTGEEYSESYDKLVIATGSSPVKPDIPGVDSPKVMQLWTIPDMDAIIAAVKERGASRAAITGGGFIGLETAENLVAAGVKVSIIQRPDQVMPPLDFEMAQLLHQNLEENGVALHLAEGVVGFEDTASGINVKLRSGGMVEADIAILSIGVTPNSAIAGAAGLALNGKGGIVTDSSMLTNDPDIYAVGDAAEIEGFVFGDRKMVPLAGPANKQGRIAADNIAGIKSEYAGTQGSSVAKVFDLTAASTGENEKSLIKRGMVRGRDYEAVIITQNSHAGYFPGAVPLTLKLIFSMDGKKIFGAQIVGRDGVDKRIDTIGVAMRLGAGVSELRDLELAYAPPYSSAKDPVNMAGYVADNLLRGLVRFATWDAAASEDSVWLDVREDAELLALTVPGAVHIPLGQVRSRLGELDRSKTIVVFCAIGVRAYNAARILMQSGFENVLVYPGGSKFYQSVHYKEYMMEKETSTAPAQTQAPAFSSGARAVRLDCSGLQCPGPIMKVFDAMKTMTAGEELEVSASDPGFTRDVEAWCRRTGNTLVSKGRSGSDYTALLRKGGADGCTVRDTPQGKTIIVFSGDLDKVLASFIIANGAAAMGRPVTMFFTFWGLTALRKTEKQDVKKTPMEAMFGKMLPRGTDKLKLSRMNMGGMGTEMMKRIMNDKNVDSLEDLMKKAMQNGVKLMACTMSMDVMGIKPEELIDGVELAGVGTYLGDAEESNVNLFI
jgi:NADPH-dependent 2,4-dienoyl-CoA reductase/sulfur reductase-like enzyme/peroxiredoxin family protein/TusA-related sulfurtransferase/rhodanese-related sulfurtransferase